MVVEVDTDLPHNHCNACYDRNCQTSPQPGNACGLVNCDVDCGARYHRCKTEEHQLLCPNVKTKCVNAVYGCPVDVQRRMICRHLEVCPASVVNCTMEWNRWPVYASERQPQQPLHLVQENFEQLDIALALRDQRMLTKSMKASKRTRQILTNALNRRHPAVPLTAQLTAYGSLDAEEEQKELDNLLQTMQDEKEAADRERARTPPGLQRSICNELYRQSHDNNGVVASSGVPAYYPWPRDPFIHCSHCARRKERIERIMASHDAMQPENGAGAGARAVNGAEAMPMDEDDHNHKHDDAGILYAAPLYSHQNGHAHHGDPMQSGLYQSDGREDNVFMDHLMETNGNNHTTRIPSFNSTLSSEDSETMQAPAVFVTQSTTGDVSTAPTRGHSKPIIIQPPAIAASALGGSDKLHRLSSSSNGSLDSRHSLSLDLSLESITRYQAKPDSMYTFLCAQEFRRDEYPYHFQNVHSDIHGGLNGWMEQRCPLAPYGCTFSQRRFYPGAEGARIIHSENLESFGLCLDGGSKETALVGGANAEKREEEEGEGATKFAKTEDVAKFSGDALTISEQSLDWATDAERKEEREGGEGATKFAKTEDVATLSGGALAISEQSMKEGCAISERALIDGSEGALKSDVSVQTKDQSNSNIPQDITLGLSNVGTDSSKCNAESGSESAERGYGSGQKDETVHISDTVAGGTEVGVGGGSGVVDETSGEHDSSADQKVSAETSDVVPPSQVNTVDLGGAMAEDILSSNNSVEGGILLVDTPIQEGASTVGESNPALQSDAQSTLGNPEISLEVSETILGDAGASIDDVDSQTSALDAQGGLDHVSHLPFELLRYLLRFLDSFTLNHVAMTSKLLRQVCCSLLEERGMVVLQWEKHRGQWVTTMKVWHFSTAFTPINHWGFENNPPIAEHLKTCPFNVRNVSTEPVPVMRLDAAAITMASRKQKASAKLAAAKNGNKDAEKEGANGNDDGLAFEVDVDVENW